MNMMTFTFYSKQSNNMSNLCQNERQRQGQGNLRIRGDESLYQHLKVRTLCMVHGKPGSPVCLWSPLTFHRSCCRTTLEDGRSCYAAFSGPWATRHWPWYCSAGGRSCGMQTGCTSRWAQVSSILQDLWAHEKTRCSLHRWEQPLLAQLQIFWLYLLID